MSINWKNHWSNYKDDPLSRINEPYLWSDFVIRHNFIFLDNIIKNYLIGVKQKKKINFLELCAGSGMFTRHCSSQDDFIFTTIDKDQHSCDLLSEYAGKNSNINVICDDIYSLPLESNSQDIIYIGGGLEYLEDIDTCLSEINRVLREDGILIANVVPNTLNIQLIGDISIYLRSFFVKGRQKKLVPNNAKRLRAKAYVKAFTENNFINIQRHFLTPYPQFSLPRFLKSAYAKVLKKNEQFLLRFNNSNFKGKEWLTISFDSKEAVEVKNFESTF